MKKLSQKYILKVILTATIYFLIHNTAFSQDKIIKYEIESQTITTTKAQVPFWMRSNQFSSIPLSGISQSFIASIYKDVNSSTTDDSLYVKRKLISWGFGFQGRANLGKGTNMQVIEGFGKIRIGVINLTVGRTKNVMGLNGDTTLSSGNFAVSGNAPGIPGLELSVPDYYILPIFKGILSIKGNFVHGWVGRQKINNSVSENYSPVTYFHQKSLYARIGKAGWKFKAYVGFNHQAYWGNEQAAYGTNFKLSKIKTFYYVLTGKRYGALGVPNSKIGNQLGSVDMGIEYNFNDITIMLYRQNFYDVGALSKLANIADGLNGITITNKNFNKKSGIFKWEKVLGEFFYSKNQAGYPWSTRTASGDEDYYNNFYYGDGWSYKGIGLGNPLITKTTDARAGQAQYGNDYFINNRVIAIHLGLEGAVNDWSFLTKMTYSSNSGTFGTSEFGHSLGNIRSPESSNIFKNVKQFSFYIESMKPLNRGLSTGFATSFDQGKLLNNSLALIIKLKKSF